MRTLNDWLDDEDDLNAARHDFYRRVYGAPMKDTPENVVARIEELLATKSYEWARPTLEGIKTTILQTGAVSLRQQEAVEHIILGRLKHDVGPV